MMSVAGRFIALLLGAYVLIVGLLAVLQTPLLFPRWAVGGTPVLPAEAGALRIERPDGAVLHGHRLRGSGTGPPILGFGGNAWNAADVALFLHRTFPEHDVIAFHFRGYRPSTGRPSARALAEDALAIHDHLTAQGLPAPLVAGFSIGIGPAARIAEERPVAGLILVTPFDSLAALARAHYPWVPVRWLLRHRMEPADALARAEAPVALIVAARDEIVPAARTEALRAALAGTAPGVVFDRTLPAGHNDLYAHPDLRDTLRAARDRVLGTPPR